MSLRHFIWSTLAGLCGVALLVALAVALGWTLSYFGLAPHATVER